MPSDVCRVEGGYARPEPLVVRGSADNRERWWEDRDVDRLTQAGLGQDYDSMALSRTTDAWIAAGEELNDAS